jgi:Integrase core domain
VLKRAGVPLSVSMIGRILRDLTRRNVLVEPISVRLRPHARHARPYAIRKPKEYAAAAPGDLVQLDTMHLTPVPGVERRHFSAVDVVSRWSVTGVRATATAGTATDFLDEVLARFPFPIRAIQVDGGSEFMAEFEAACQERGITLFVLPPRSPSSTAMSNGPTARIVRSSGSSMTASSRCLPCKRPCAPGRRRTITPGPTKPWAIAPLPSTWLRSVSLTCSGRTEREQCP